MDREVWRMASDREWVEWCRSNIGLLAREYLRRVEEGKPVNGFFGSWLEFAGRSQVGRFLGHEFVRFPVIIEVPLMRIPSPLGMLLIARSIITSRNESLFHHRTSMPSLVATYVKSLSPVKIGALSLNAHAMTVSSLRYSTFWF